MLRNFPKNVEVLEICKKSYERGVEVRLTGVLYSAIILAVMLVVLALVENISDRLVAAIAISVSSLCVIWAIYSVSASLNMQSDTITGLLVHYAEKEQGSADVPGNA